MKQTKRKGFTIVELVIVIAVIAILAAVLIPTFASLINKANRSADDQAVKQMNTALAIYTAEKGEPSDYFELKKALDENDINTDSLSPFSKGYAFYWDKAENEILLIKEGDNIPAGAVILNSNASENFEAASINGTTYNSLQSAIDAAENNATIVLSNDVKINEPLLLNGDKTITIDLNGKTIYHTDIIGIWSGDKIQQSVISVQGSNTNVTIKGNGEVRALAGDVYAIDIKDGAKCTIDGGTFIGNMAAVLVDAGEVTINGGTFGIQQLANTGKPYGYVLNCIDTNYKNGSAKITVNGGTFQEFNPSDNPEGDNTSFVAEGKTVTSSTVVFGGFEYKYYTVS